MHSIEKLFIVSTLKEFFGVDLGFICLKECVITSTFYNSHLFREQIFVKDLLFEPTNF